MMVLGADDADCDDCSGGGGREHDGDQYKVVDKMRYMDKMSLRVSNVFPFNSLPGSMPPQSSSLREEGAASDGFKIVSGGIFNSSAVEQFLNEPAKVASAQHSHFACLV